MATVAVLAALLAVTLGPNEASSAKIYKVCATERRAPDYLCVGLNKGNTEVNCARVVDSADCARSLYSGTADFALFSPEEILLASKYPRLNEATRVVAEMRHIERENEPFAFEAVVVVKADYSGLLSGLKGKNFCHAGFADSQLWTDRVLKYFERKVVPQKCDVTRPLVEDEMSNLVNFFNSSCRPGPWSLSDYRDRMLKSKYPQLCSLCDNPRGCAYNTERFGSHEAALVCLAEKGGDVAYVALQYVKDFFGLGDRKPRANPDNYRFLCPDGSMQTLKTQQPCAWLRQPWPAVVASKNVAGELVGKLQGWLTPTNLRARENWQSYLSQIVFHDRSKLNSAVIAKESMPTMSWYMLRGRNDTLAEPPPEGSQCRPSVRWCVSTPLEAEKCDILRMGAYTYGLEPSIQCVRGSSMWECMTAIRNMTADILAIDTEYSLIARVTYGLNALIYQETLKESSFKILAVVRPESGVKKLADLKRKTACFPEFGGLAWTAWVDTARDLQLLPRKCPAAASVANFFYRACAPGADDSVHNPDGSGRSALCALCPSSISTSTAQPLGGNSGNNDGFFTSGSKCVTNSRNGYYSDAGALRCLADKQGDVAFVDLRAISDVDSSAQVVLRPEYRNDEYRVLCRNGSVSNRVGLLVDDNCVLAYGTGGEMVVRDSSEVMSVDAALLLLDLENWFGYDSTNYESALNMFGPFRGASDVIFKSKVAGFVSIFDSENLQTSSFAALMNRNKDCSMDKTSAASSAASSALLLGAALALAALVCRAATG